MSFDDPLRVNSFVMGLLLTVKLVGVLGLKLYHRKQKSRIRMGRAHPSRN